MLNRVKIVNSFLFIFGMGSLVSATAQAQTPIILPEIDSNDTFVSFTPTKVMAPIIEIKLSKSGDDSHSTALYMCPSSEPEECLVEVTSENALNSLLSQGAGSESFEVQAGTYDRVVIGSGDRAGKDYFVYVEGEVELNGVLHYTSSEVGKPLTTDLSKKGPVKIRYNMGAYDFPIKGGLQIEAEDTIELTLVFTDKFIAQAGTTVSKGGGLGHCTHLYTHVANSNPSSYIPDSDNPAISEPGVCMRYPHIAPIVGTKSVKSQGVDISLTIPVTRPNESANQTAHMVLIYDHADEPRHGIIVPKVAVPEDKNNLGFILESFNRASSGAGYDIVVGPAFDGDPLNLLNFLPTHNKVTCAYKVGANGRYDLDGACSLSP